MEYTKDVVWGIQYGQGEKRRNSFLGRIVHCIRKHKFITSVLGITFLLIVLDFMMLSSFVQVLSEL